MDYSKQIADLLSTPDPFRNWLRSKHQDREVGYCGSPTRCALAQFLEASLHCGVSVTPKFFVIVWSHESYSLPKWAMDFIVLHDSEYDEELPITAARALELL